MKIFDCILILLLAASANAAQRRNTDALTCFVPPSPPREEMDIVSPSSPVEAARLHQSPHIAKRLSKHRLQVSWVGGNHIFEDLPPYDQPLAGVAWAYCGYSPALQVHLVFKADKDVFTGVLLDDNTGRLLAAGERVSFSPDRKLYIAYEQPDGQDGETIKLYTRDGGLVWKGYNGIIASDGISVVANFLTLGWDARNRPQVSVQLRDGLDLTLTLTQGSDGKREWLPRVVCHFEGSGINHVLKCDSP